MPCASCEPAAKLRARMGSAGSGQCRGAASTRFYLNGRACGAVRVQARAPIARRGGGFGFGGGAAAV